MFDSNRLVRRYRLTYLITLAIPPIMHFPAPWGFNGKRPVFK